MMSVQVRLEALKLAVSMRGVTDEAQVLSVASSFETFINDGTVAFKRNKVQDAVEQQPQRKRRKLTVS